MEVVIMEDKKELLQRVKELSESEDAREAYYEVKKLAKHFYVRDDDSYYEQELSNEFDGYLKTITDKLGDINAISLKAKEDIIEKAKELLDKVGSRSANDQMKDLMANWKQSGHLAKEKEDELWEQFNAIRTEFFDKKQKYFDELKESFAKKTEAKKGLIEKAKAVLELDNMSEAAKSMNNLMNEWKAVGSAGKENENALWEQFNAIRKEFFAKKSSYNEAMKQEYVKRVEAKQALIAEAKLCLARSEFSEDEIEAMKNIRSRWKEVGFAGKENDNDLWEQFSPVVNKYFENLKFYK